MNISRLDALLCCVLVATSATCIGCKHSAPAPPVESYTQTENSVGLDLIPLGNSDASPRWLAVYADDGKTTKFAIELDALPAADGGGAPSMGKGRFSAQTESDPIPLLDSLRKALQAKRMPNHVQKVDTLPFEYLSLGEHQSRNPDGSFSPKPPGNWTTTKIFLANDTAEVYLNFNLVIHKAEFAMKDPSFGDRVLAELARVF